MEKNHFAQAARITVPVFFGYVAIGIPFGLMIVNAGYPVWLVPVMSAVMYAGAGQYVAMGLFAAGASLGTIAVTELLVNIRHIVYGLSLITKFKHTGAWKPYIIFALTDETYSLLTSCTVPDGADAGAFYGTIALLDHIYWIAGGIIGAVAGTFIPFSFEGVEFALTALFIVLLIEQLEKSRDLLPPALGAAVALCSVVLAQCGVIADGNILLVSLAFSLAALIFVRGRKFNNTAVRGKTAAKTAAQEREVER
ncbi:MAG: AzlC family ABC transporter permease [Treponema sp.]|nr:AzlC family ABC transporter permease [Treponema sp.]